MYKKYKSGEITLWCDSRSNEETGRKRKNRAEEHAASKSREMEERRDEIIQELQDHHEDEIPAPNTSLGQTQLLKRFIAA